MTFRPTISYVPLALRLATLCVLTATGFLARDARADVVRTFTFSPHDVAVVQGPAGVVVAIQRGVPDGAPGGPELPAVPVFIELEPGQRVRSSTITATAWAPLGTAPGRLRTAASESPGQCRGSPAVRRWVYRPPDRSSGIVPDGPNA